MNHSGVRQGRAEEATGKHSPRAMRLPYAPTVRCPVQHGATELAPASSLDAMRRAAAVVAELDAARLERQALLRTLRDAMVRRAGNHVVGTAAWVACLDLAGELAGKLVADKELP